MSAALLGSTSALAAEDCADTSAKLIQYLNKAETQSSPYKIKIVAGTYALSGLKYQWSPTASTTIEGGYADCANRGVVNAALTTIDSSALSAGFQLLLDTGNLEVDGITFAGGAVTALNAGEIGSGNLSVTRSRFTQTMAAFAVQDGSLFLENLLVDHALPYPGTDCAAQVLMNGDDSFQWNFVTIDTGVNNNFCVDTGHTSHHNTGRIYNSIVWPGAIHMSADIWQGGDIFTVDVFSSVFDNALVEHGVFTEHDSVHSNPLWTNPAAGVYTLQVPPSPISPAINAGAPAAQIPGGISATDTDIGGNPRVIGSAPDMGAYESAVDDADVFGVTTTDDCSTPLNQPSCGSLRDAIARANAPTSTAPSKTIKFWITDPFLQPMCPAVIGLNSPLPDITSKVTIDGYTQGSIQQVDPALSWPNTDPYIFNASLCVAIVGSGTTGYALRVPSGSNGALTLRGVGLGNFIQGVMLLGGANHQIVGNQFGGVTSTGVNLHGFSQKALNVSPSIQPSGALIVGGINVADRNVFLNALAFGGVSANAILIGANVVSDPTLCQIVGNLVGIDPDGTTAPGNDYGLVLTGDGCTIKNNWITGSHKGAIWVQGQHYIVQSNVLGLAPRSFAPQNNGGAGIRVTGSNNVIGAPSHNYIPPMHFDVGLGNYIADMQDSGIVVVPPGTNNTLRGNVVQTSGDLAIDLGEDGLTANDAGDIDAGANNSQNFPRLAGLSWTSPPQPNVWNDATLLGTLTARAGLYNVDVYLGEGCDVGGRGLPQLWLDRYTVSVVDETVATGFTIPVEIPDNYYDPAKAALSLTATSLTDGNTSEVGSCMSIDTLFQDAYEM